MSNKIGFLGVTMCLALAVAVIAWWAGMSMIEAEVMLAKATPTADASPVILVPTMPRPA